MSSFLSSPASCFELFVTHPACPFAVPERLNAIVVIRMAAHKMDRRQIQHFLTTVAGFLREIFLQGLDVLDLLSLILMQSIKIVLNILFDLSEVPVFSAHILDQVFLHDFEFQSGLAMEKLKYYLGANNLIFRSI